MNTPDRILVGESAEWDMISEEKKVWVLFLKFNFSTLSFMIYHSLSYLAIDVVLLVACAQCFNQTKHDPRKGKG